MKYKIESAADDYYVVELETESVIMSNLDSKTAQKMAQQLQYKAFEGFTPYFFVMHQIGVFR